MKKIFIISLLVVSIFLVYYYFINIDYETFNTNEIMSISQVITIGQDDIINNVSNNTTLKQMDPFQKMMTSGENKSSSEIQISYIRNQFGSYKNETARSLFEKMCNIGYLQILGKILNVYSENNEIINIFGTRIKENVDKIYEEKKNGALNISSQDIANVKSAEQNKVTTKQNLDNATKIEAQKLQDLYYYYNDYVNHSKTIYSSYDVYNGITQCFKSKIDIQCSAWHPNDGASKCQTKPDKRDQYRLRNSTDGWNSNTKKNECTSEIQGKYNTYIYYNNLYTNAQNEKSRASAAYTAAINAYDTALANSQNKNFIKKLFESYRSTIDDNLKKLASTTPPFSDELSPPDNNSVEPTEGTPAPTKKPVSETLLEQQRNVIFQNYIYCMKDICNRIIDSNLNADNVTDITDNKDALLGPLYLNINDIKMLSNGIEPLILSLRDSGGAGGLGGFGGDSGGSGFPSL